MKCPHCLTMFHDTLKQLAIGRDADGGWMLNIRLCSACNRLVLHLANGNPIYSQNSIVRIEDATETMVRPKSSGRSPCPGEVPLQYSNDYKEACLVLSDSPKAAAALARRCLQNILRGIALVKPGNLADEIQQVLDSRTLPSQLADSIDAIRNIGNFAAHPMKSQQSGQIVDVEPGEAEWNIDVLEMLFDFYFVQPELIKVKRAALNQKLQAVGKPPMK